MASPLLHMGFSLSFGIGWRFKLYERSKACIRKDEYRMAVERKTDMKNPGEIEGSILTRNITSLDCEKVQNYKLPPLVGALKGSAAENAASFHFPGHNRGQAAPSSFTQLIGKRPYLHDLPELPELDNLFSPEGPILEAQRKAAELFGASETWFLIGGSTCGVQAAVMATCSPGDNIILPRNCHLSAISAMILSGALPKYVMPEYSPDWDIASGITPSQVEKAIKELEMEGEKVGAVFVVSPTYHGICSNVAEISQLCHLYNVPLIVDEAHGAHFGFHQLLPSSALFQGADLAVQSTHKVLCSLTQSSMLHMSGDLVDRDRICRCLQTLQSSSPSYLLLASLDAARAQVSEEKEIIFNSAIELAMGAKSMISKIPNVSVLDIRRFPQFPAIDPLRITIGTQHLGLSAIEADDILSKDFGVVSELVGTRSMTLAFNLGTQREHVLRLISGLNHLSAISATTNCKSCCENDLKPLTPFDDINMSLSPREAFFAHKTKVGIKDSVGQICGELICPYPPGIPVLIPGEVISEGALDYLQHVRNKCILISGASDPLLSSILNIILYLPDEEDNCYATLLLCNTYYAWSLF